VKNQIAPWGDPLMLENPGEELSFGEVYRQIVQEAWLPGASEYWSVVGKSRRGSRPPQRGITSPNIPPDQEVVRRCFSKCAAAWNELPWFVPTTAFCDNRQGRKYWLDFKESEGYVCSYYDLYMRFCIRYCLDTACLPPANYLLKVDGDLTNIDCSKVYDLSFPNKCGDVSFVSGEGTFVPPSEWVSPAVPTAGDLCFKDENGSYGSIPFSMPGDWVLKEYWITQLSPTYEPWCYICCVKGCIENNLMEVQQGKWKWIAHNVSGGFGSPYCSDHAWANLRYTAVDDLAGSNPHELVHPPPIYGPKDWPFQYASSSLCLSEPYNCPEPKRGCFVVVGYTMEFVLFGEDEE